MNQELPEFLKELLPKFLSSLKKHTLSDPVKSYKMEAGLTSMIQKYHPGKKIAGSHIRQMVRHLRRNGYPIGSGSYGYYWAKDMKEWEEGIKNLRSRALDLLQTYREARKIKIEIDLFNNETDRTFNSDNSDVSSEVST